MMAASGREIGEFRKFCQCVGRIKSISSPYLALGYA